MPAWTAERAYSAAILAVATALFARAAWTQLAAHLASSAGSRAQVPAPAPAPKPTHASAVNVQHAATLDMCDVHPAHPNRFYVRAGALLKLVDVVAGVAARRHAALSCVTVSVDAVLLLAPIPLSSLIHLSASVNRAWGSSMEVGVRVLCEIDGCKTYVSHAYLTFVALPSATGGLKPSLAPLEPRTTLEARRHLLAGRRRAKRIEDSKRGDTRDGVSQVIKRRLRDEVAALQAPGEEPQLGEQLSAGGEGQAERIELEWVARAWAAHDPAVRVTASHVFVSLPGDETFRHPLAAVTRLAAELGLVRPAAPSVTGPPGWSITRPRALSEARLSEADAESESHSADLGEWVAEARLLAAELPGSQTLSRSLHLVFPEHTNSQQRLFGGQTMAWMEACALNAARSLGPAWSTVAVDGLEFAHPVLVGEILILRAVVVRTFASSVEVFVQAQAEDHAGALRWTNDALFTLTCGPTSEERKLPRIVHPPGSALEAFAAPAAQRRAARLEMRDMLRRVYS